MTMPDTTPQALTAEELAGLRAHYPNAERHADIHALLATIAHLESNLKMERETLRILREESEPETVLLARIICLTAERDALKAEVEELQHELLRKQFRADWNAVVTPAKETDNAE